MTADEIQSLYELIILSDLGPVIVFGRLAVVSGHQYQQKHGFFNSLSILKHILVVLDDTGKLKLTT